MIYKGKLSVLFFQNNNLSDLITALLFYFCQIYFTSYIIYYIYHIFGSYMHKITLTVVKTTRLSSKRSILWGRARGYVVLCSHGNNLSLKCFLGVIFL